MIVDGSLFSHTILTGCAYLRDWGHVYPPSGCNFHGGVCVGCGWECGDVWSSGDVSVSSIKTKDHSNFPEPTQHPQLLGPLFLVSPCTFLVLLVTSPDLYGSGFLVFLFFFLLGILHLTHSCSSFESVTPLCILVTFVHASLSILW